MEFVQPADPECVMFAAPPINELVLGVYHSSIVELKAEHIGRYWNSILDRYPKCEQQAVVGFQNEGQPMVIPQPAPGEVYPLPRFWFSSKENTLIQVQRNGFLVNWRRGSNDDDYPRYNHMEQLFWRELDHYREFVEEIGGSLDTVQRCELVYTNLIGPNAFYTDQTQLGNILPPVVSLSEAAIEGATLTWINATAAYDISNRLTIESTVRSGKRADTMEIAAMLDLKAQGTPSDFSLEGAKDWFKAAHRAVHKLFLAFTDNKVQTEIWRRS